MNVPQLVHIQCQADFVPQKNGNPMGRKEANRHYIGTT